MQIREIVVFAYATKGEALEVANLNDGTAVATVHIVRGGVTPAKEPVCYLVVPESYPNATPAKRK